MEEEKNKRSLCKTVLIIFLSILGTIIGIVIILAVWLWVKNPLNIRALVLNYFGLAQTEIQVDSLPSITAPANPDISPAPSTNTGGLPVSDAQREAVEKAGIDVDAITITPEMEACFTATLGEARVLEIINGDVPGPLDIFKARSCL